LALVAFACAGPAAFITKPFDAELNEQWAEFKIRYGKSYSTAEAEIARRMIFEQNVKKIQKHNLEYDMGVHSYFLGINKFADNTFEEFKQFLKPFNLKEKKGATYLPPAMSEIYQPPLIGEQKVTSQESKTKDNAVLAGLSLLLVP